MLLDVKLSVPQIRPGMVSRARLIEAAQSSPARAAGITAPAGYGKSTLLYEWARAEDRVVGWVSLDRLDDDPGILLAVLASAYVRMFPSGAGLVADVSGLGVSALGRAAPVVASAFRRSPAPFVLMLDDLHELQLPGVSRRPGRGDLRHPDRLAAGDGEPLRAAASAPAAGLRRRPGAGGRGPRAGARRRRADLLDVPRPADRGPGHARHRTDRGLAGRPAAGRDDRPRHPPGRLDGLRRRPLRGRLPLPRVPEPAGRGNPAASCAERRCSTSCTPRSATPLLAEVGQPGPVAGPRGVELVPDPARPPAGVVPLPPAVPGVPAQRAASRRARHRHEAAPGALPTGTRPTAPRRWPSSTC